MGAETMVSMLLRIFPAISGHRALTMFSTMRHRVASRLSPLKFLRSFMVMVSLQRILFHRIRAGGRKKARDRRKRTFLG